MFWATYILGAMYLDHGDCMVDSEWPPPTPHPAFSLGDADLELVCLCLEGIYPLHRAISKTCGIKLLPRKPYLAILGLELYSGLKGTKSYVSIPLTSPLQRPNLAPSLAQKACLSLSRSDHELVLAFPKLMCWPGWPYWPWVSAWKMRAWKPHVVVGLPADRQVAWLHVNVSVWNAIDNKASFVWGSVSVICRIIRNHQKLDGLKQQPFYLLMTLWVNNLG